MDNERIIYSINVEDVQNVAEQEFGRTLTEAEVNLIEDKVGDYFAWYDTLLMAIEDNLDIERSDEDEDDSDDDDEDDEEQDENDGDE